MAAASTASTIHILGGSGSVGLLFASRLSSAGHRVTLLLRDESLAAFRALEAAQGRPAGTGALVTLTRPDDKQQTPPLRAAVTAEPASVASSPSSSSFPIANLIVATKACAAAPALRALAEQRRLDRGRTCALLLCNGVLAVRDEVLGRRRAAGAAAQPPPPPPPPLPLRRLLVASVGHGVFRPPGQPFTAVHAGLGETVIGDLEEGAGKQQQEEEELVRALRLAGPLLGARWEADPKALRGALLTKLAINCAANAAAALLRCRNGGMLADANPAAAELQRRVLGEFAMVFGGGEEERRRLEAATTDLLSRTRGNVNSMLQDILALPKPGGRTEIDYLNGWVVEQARAKGVDVPANETLALLIRAAEASAGNRVGGG